MNKNHLQFFMDQNNILQQNNLFYRKENWRLKADLDQAMLLVEQLQSENRKLTAGFNDTVKTEIDVLIRQAGGC